MQKSVLIIGSVTHAIKAQRALSDNNVPSKVVKTQTTKNGKGCVYGIELEWMYSDTAERILNAYGISYKKPPLENDVR
jgi:hypothetical protein